MRIDYDYLKDEIFPKFLDAETPAISFGSDLFKFFDEEDPETGLPNNKTNKFIFHWKLLEDAKYVGGAHGSDKSPIRKYYRRQILYVDMSIRLTKEGQEFAENLEKSKPEWVSKITGYGMSVASETLKSIIVGSITS